LNIMDQEKVVFETGKYGFLIFLLFVAFGVGIVFEYDKILLKIAGILIAVFGFWLIYITRGGKEIEITKEYISGRNIFGILPSYKKILWRDVEEMKMIDLSYGYLKVKKELRTLSIGLKNDQKIEFYIGGFEEVDKIAIKIEEYSGLKIKDFERPFGGIKGIVKNTWDWITTIFRLVSITGFVGIPIMLFGVDSKRAEVYYYIGYGIILIITLIVEKMAKDKKNKKIQ
ncbi:MAG: hypothetical protein ACD_26C00087G0001, partial [uncultured bacterium]